MTDEHIRDIFMAHGFTIKEGQTDLKPYVYAAARALLSASKPAIALPFAGDIARAIHYPECWDTSAYPSFISALREVYSHFRCSDCASPAAPAQSGGPFDMLEAAHTFLAEKCAHVVTVSLMVEFASRYAAPQPVAQTGEDS